VAINDVSSSDYDVGQRQLHCINKEEDNDSWIFPASVIVIVLIAVLCLKAANCMI